jgi:hypothetical protein
MNTNSTLIQTDQAPFSNYFQGGPFCIGRARTPAGRGCPLLQDKENHPPRVQDKILRPRGRAAALPYQAGEDFCPAPIRRLTENLRLLMPDIQPSTHDCQCLFPFPIRWERVRVRAIASLKTESKSSSTKITALFPRCLRAPSRSAWNFVRNPSASLIVARLRFPIPMTKFSSQEALTEIRNYGSLFMHEKRRHSPVNLRHLVSP